MFTKGLSVLLMVIGVSLFAASEATVTLQSDSARGSISIGLEGAFAADVTTGATTVEITVDKPLAISGYLYFTSGATVEKVSYDSYTYSTISDNYTFQLASSLSQDFFIGDTCYVMTTDSSLFVQTVDTGVDYSVQITPVSGLTAKTLSENPISSDCSLLLAGSFDDDSQIYTVNYDVKRVAI